MIVVGAGIIGLSCAWRLAQRGHQITIFDSREIACEASWAGAGMLAPGGELEEASPLTQMALSSLALYPRFVAELRESSGISIDYQRCGALEIALTEAEAESLERRSSRQAELGIHSEIATYNGSVSARFYPADQLVAPRDLTAALHLACVRAGVKIRTNESVTQVRSNGSIRTQLGDYQSDGVVIAAGAWSSTLFPNLPLTMPVRGHLVSYDMNRTLLSAIVRHQGTYILQRSNGALIAGSSTEHVGFNRSIDEFVVRDIHERASRLLPTLASVRPSSSWNGFRPGVAGDTPMIGQIENTQVWTAFGHYRNGILLAPETAHAIATMVSDSLQ